MVQPHASRKDYEQALQGLEFPASLSEIQNRARDIGGIDREVNEMIDGLPDRQYESLDDLFGALRQAYLASHVPAELIPF